LSFDAPGTHFPQYLRQHKGVCGEVQYGCRLFIFGIRVLKRFLISKKNDDYFSLILMLS
jgi:hypothetical protein